MLRRLTGDLRRRLERIRANEHHLALILSLVIGALVGLVIVAFILLTGRLAARMYPAGVAAWRRLLVPTIGSLIAGWLLFRFFPLARGSGIPQTKFALFVENGVISLRTVIGKFVCCALSLASGIALGREGPSVQIGAGLASVLGQRLGLSPARIKALIPVGSSAALAAAFNTPIAAVLFSLEEIVGDLHAPVLGGVVLSSATAWIVLQLFLGDAPLFHVAGYRLVHPAELAVYAVLGVVGGLASVAFVKLLLWLRQRFLALGTRAAWLHPVVGGLTVGVLGYAVPEVVGVGYDYVERVLNGDVVLRVLVLLAVLKIVATAVCYASGNAGGIFGPSLFIGAMVGGAVGAAARELFPATTADPGAYALVGMGTAFAGIIRTPLTSVIMIFELTRDYTIIVPLMISNLIAFYVSHRLQRVPIYEAIAHQDGVHLPSGESRGYGGARVVDAMRPVPDGTAPETVIATAVTHAREARLEAWPVVDATGLRGLVQTSDLEAAAAAGLGERPLSDLSAALHTSSTSALPHVHMDHSLALALERMGTSGYRLLPVVSRANVRALIGLVTLGDLLGAFGVAPSRRPRDDTNVETRDRRLPPVALVGMSVALIVTVAVLGLADTWLARVERHETQADAHRLFTEGVALDAHGRHDEAVERLRGALFLARNDRRFEVALARALLGADRPDEAGRLLDSVLQRDAIDAEANLEMARAQIRLRQPTDATSYYHRAIFGRWPSNAENHRRAVRLELVEVLAQQRRNDELLAELLPLEEQTRDSSVERRIAALYLTAGAPERSLAVWRRLRRMTPDDAEIEAGIGEAELARRNDRAAQAAFRTAVRLEPDDQRLRDRLSLCDAVLALDPTRRGLTARERYQRSVTLWEQVRDRAQRCVALDPLAEAITRPEGRSDAVRLDEQTEANIDRAERVWQSWTQRCRPAASAADEPLRLVLTRTSQS